MPLYAYRCQSCENTFDALNSYENRLNPEQEPCPKCGKETVKYTVSAPKIGYMNPGTMKTTDNFNDRLKEIKKRLPEKYKGGINAVIR
jgi:putative FmdB family regulatory protein